MTAKDKYRPQKRMTKISIILILLSVRAISFAGASDSDTVLKSNEDRSCFQMCLVGGYLYTYEEIGIIASAELTINTIVYSASWLWAGEFNLFGPEPLETTAEYSVLIGKKANYRFGYLSASAGLSLINFLRRGELISQGSGLLGYSVHTEKQSVVIGIPIRGNLVIKLYHFGIGLHLQCNINNVDPTAGAGMVVYLGTYSDPTSQ